MWSVLVVLASAAMSAAVFTNQFAVRIPSGDPAAVAAKHGFLYLGQIGSLKDYYLFEHPRVHKRSLQPHPQQSSNLKAEPQVVWFRQQEVKKRKKRDVEIPITASQTSKIAFPDPLYKHQWYLNGGAEDGLDMNVGPAWAKGYTGKGVVVSILDDGIQTNHPDLIDNYDPKASSDINDNDSDPMPRDNGDNKHGTRCAGEVAAIAFNSYCGVGVAYNASIGGVRMLDGTVSDAVEARALSLNPDHIDIYSASWGPEDDGKTVDGPGPLATRAFLSGITTGRNGKGSIFVWASGNGGKHTDSCNCDGYTNTIYTLSISSATQAGFKPWYLEECSSTIATTYSSGILGRDKSVASVDMDPKLRPEHLCTTEHTGTSASAPLAAGMCALALEANPDLTWRDMQHIIVMSANPKPLSKETGWITNGAHRKVSHKFGFGLMDGGVMVELAEQWTTVPTQHLCQTPEIHENKILEPDYESKLSVSTNVTGCEGSLNEVRYLEHVQCRLTLNFSPRGNLRIVLKSPQGTPSVLLSQRPRDVISSNFDSWAFLSIHFWGEDPRGVWTLSIINAGPRKADSNGILKKWELLFYGTETNPIRLKPPSLQMFKKKHPVTEEEAKVPGENYEDNNIEDGLEIIYDCHEECDKTGCYGPQNTQCISCLHFKLNKRCVAECPEGYYRTSKECLECNKDCLSCTGPGRDSCLTCASHLFYVTDLALCIMACPHTYYQDTENRKCLSCSENCATCQESPNQCTSCEAHLVFYNHSCLPSCPTGTFQNRHQRCVECHSSCTACTGPKLKDCIMGQTEMFCSDGNCSECPQGMIRQNNSCVTGCDIGWYRWGNVCKKCWPGCSSCFGGRRDECIKCTEGRSLARGQCRLHCPRNMYSTPHGCTNCHHFCSTCNGGGAYACTTCARQRYQDDSSGLCYSCHSSCSECAGPGSENCTVCDKGSLLHDGTCIPSASLSQLSDSQLKEMTHSAAAGKRRSYEVFSAEEPQYRRTKPPEYSPFVTVTIIAVIACLAILILFALLFATLQVR
ncbi:furin-like protease 2 [Halyomorpha halys]|uniref:furin-like protease 2 n=1 Tax=Halyomorpha halys TaxID=286706 RepID=UPI0006D4EF3F